jgi:hypothetical protein
MTKANALIPVAAAAIALLLAGAPNGLAQDASVTSTETSTETSIDTTDVTSSSTTTSSRTRATASYDLIKELIQRSKARTEKAQATGGQEQFGSEEPFTYDPNK